MFHSMDAVAVYVQRELVVRHHVSHAQESVGGIVGVGRDDAVEMRENVEVTGAIVGVAGRPALRVADRGQTVQDVVAVGNGATIGIGELGEISILIVPVAQNEALGIGETVEPPRRIVRIGAGPQGIVHAGKPVEGVIGISHLRSVRVRDAGKLSGGGIGIDADGPVSIRNTRKSSVRVVDQAGLLVQRVRLERYQPPQVTGVGRDGACRIGQGREPVHGVVAKAGDFSGSVGRREGISVAVVGEARHLAPGIGLPGPAV
jgi:hypothetical protein